MELQLTGKLISINNAQEGTSAKGAWRKANAVFETQEQYPKFVALEFWNAKLEEIVKIPLGTILNVKFDLESREWNGKWYTNAKGYAFDPYQSSTHATPSEPAATPSQAPQPQQPQIFDNPLPPLNEPETDDLPF